MQTDLLVNFSEGKVTTDHNTPALQKPRPKSHLKTMVDRGSQTMRAPLFNNHALASNGDLVEVQAVSELNHENVQLGPQVAKSEDENDFPTLNSRFEHMLHDPLLPTPMQIKSLNSENSLADYELLDDLPQRKSTGTNDRSLSIKEKSERQAKLKKGMKKKAYFRQQTDFFVSGMNVNSLAMQAKQPQAAPDPKKEILY